MDQIQPIPGVVYTIQRGPKDYVDLIDAMYAPWGNDDSQPWMSASLRLFALQEEDRILREVFNPHPPARTEYGIEYDYAQFGGLTIEPLPSKEMFGEFASCYDVPSKLVARQVSDWKEAA